MRTATAFTLACAGAAGLASSDAFAQADVRLGYAVQVHQANMMILEEAAAERGINLDMTPMRRYADLQLALTTDQLDMVVLGWPSLGLMEEAGFTDYRVVAGVFNGAQSLTLAPHVEVEGWTDVEGLRIGSAPNSTAELLFKSSVTVNGGNIDQVEFVSFTTVGPPMLAALRDGDIDGFIAWEPNNAEAYLGGYGVYSSLDIADNPTRGVNGVLVADADFIEAHPERVEAVVAALVETTDRLNDDLDLYIETARLGTGAAADIVETSIPRGSLDYRIYSNEGKAMLQLIHSAGITSQDWSGRLDDRFDYSFLERATGLSWDELGG